MAFFILVDPTAKATRLSSTKDGDGPYLHDPTKSLVITETATTTTQPLEANHSYPIVHVTDSSLFPDTSGFVVFAFGFGNEVGPVPYLGVSGSTALLLDPAFVIPVAVPSGVVVNLAARMSDDQTPHGDGDFWLTPSPAGREACENDIDSIAAGGRNIVKTVLYPGDQGLAGAGLPTRGASRLTGAVSVWASDDVDSEVELAKES
jgi:hypothetical protein